MKKTIYKYPISMTRGFFGEFQLSLPEGAVFLHAGLDANGTSCLWFEVDPGKDVPEEVRAFETVGTGHSFEPEGKTHLASFVEDVFVWHLYEHAN